MALQEWSLVKDWPSGTLYAEKDGKSVALGRWTRASAWQWNVEGVRSVDPTAAVDTLAVGMEA
jgi:hypothetical protein